MYRFGRINNQRRVRAIVKVYATALIHRHRTQPHSRYPATTVAVETSTHYARMRAWGMCLWEEVGWGDAPMEIYPRKMHPCLWENHSYCYIQDALVCINMGLWSWKQYTTKHALRWCYASLAR